MSSNWRDVPDTDPTDDDEDVACPGYVSAVLGFDPDEQDWSGVDNTFCPTGSGGGVDPSCSPGSLGAMLGLLGKSKQADEEARDDRTAGQLRQAVLDKLTDEERVEELQTVLNHCSAEALRRIDRHVDSVTAHADTDSVDAAFNKATGEQATNTLGCYLVKSRQLHFDGLGTEEGVETVAHELGHSIDGPHYKLSRSEQWHEAYREEIDKAGDPLSGYARTKPCEGFAEYARLVLTGQLDAAKRFSKCFAFWQERGLIQ